LYRIFFGENKCVEKIVLFILTNKNSYYFISHNRVITDGIKSNTWWRACICDTFAKLWV